MGAGKFGAGRTTAVAATRAQLSGAHMMTGNLPVVPSRASLSASGRAAAPSTIRNNSSRHFFGTQSTSHRESFQQQTAHLQQSMQQSHFSPVTAGSRASASSSIESRSASAAGSGRANAVTTASGREVNSGAMRSAGNQAVENENGSRGGSAASADLSGQSSSSLGEPNRSEWKTFTPPSHTESAERGGSSAEATSRGESGSYWNRTAPSSTYSRGESGSSNYERGGSSRPQLNMRQPIVQPRSSGSYGGYHGAPSSGGGASHSAPSSGGGSHPSGGGGHTGGGHH